VLRVVFTAVSYSTGVPGGIFAPMLAMGAILGILLGKVSTLILPSADNVPTALAIVGMAAVFGAVVRAPLTGVILVVEMTGNYHLLLPLMVASMTAYLIAGRLGSPPVYDALLGIDLARTSTPPTSPDDVMWLELVVEDQAPAAHCCVSGLNWPEGCLVVTITRGMHELVPSGHTRLRPGDQLRVVVETDDNLKSAQIVRASTTAPA
jgi:CIC family chloride channel protein